MGHRQIFFKKGSTHASFSVSLDGNKWQWFQPSSNLLCLPSSLNNGHLAVHYLNQQLGSTSTTTQHNSQGFTNSGCLSFANIFLAYYAKSFSNIQNICTNDFYSETGLSNQMILWLWYMHRIYLAWHGSTRFRPAAKAGACRSDFLTVLPAHGGCNGTMDGKGSLVYRCLPLNL